MNWIVKNHDAEISLQLTQDGNFPDGYEAFVKWDRCIDIHQKSLSGEDYHLHACDIDRLIEGLTNMRDVARRHFGNSWPEQGWLKPDLFHKER